MGYPAIKRTQNICWIGTKTQQSDWNGKTRYMEIEHPENRNEFRDRPVLKKTIRLPIKPMPTLLSIISDHNIPNFLVAKHFSPSHHIFLVTPGMEPKAQHLKNALKDHGQSTFPYLHPIRQLPGNTIEINSIHLKKRNPTSSTLQAQNNSYLLLFTIIFNTKILFVIKSFCCRQIVNLYMI